MRLAAVAVLSAIIMTLSPLAFAAQSHGDSALHDTLSDVGLKFKDQVKQVMDEYRGLAQANKALKEAGASYQKSLTAPTDTLSHHVTLAQRSVMAGVYTFDAGYAALFQRKKEMGMALGVRKALNEKIGFAMPLSPKMKALIQNPDSIRDFSAWTDALDEAVEKFMASGSLSDIQLATMVNTVYGMIIEGTYIVTESIALADYPPQMLALMNTQHDRIDFLLKVMNVFRNDPAFEKALGFQARLDFLGSVNTVMMVSEFTPREVDALRSLIAPERKAVLEGDLRGFASN